MASPNPGRGWWLAALVILFLVFTGIFWPFVDDERPAERTSSADPYVDSVRVTSWNWRDDRTGTIFAVYGTAKNLSSQDIRQVVFELRAEDADGQTIARHPVTLRKLPAGAEKPFREDVPRSGKEAKGFLDVKRVVR